MTINHICVVTGTRGEYGPLKLLIEMINASKKLKLSLLVTGMHLLRKYGNTIEDIKKDGIPIAKIIPMYKEEESGIEGLGKAVGRAIGNFTTALYELKPDLLVIAGDRFESLAAVIVATTLSIPIAHIQGGDNVYQGQVDEQIRHAITKFAHIHFPATHKNAERIRLMGEADWRIHMVGAIAVDMIFKYKKDLLSREEICKKLNLDCSKKIILCLQHPYSFEPDKAGEQIHLTLKVLNDLNLQTVIIYPNNDPGSELIIKEILSFKNTPNLTVFQNLNRMDFLSLQNNADLLIGNSSTGIIEAPVFKLPVVNIGNRNKGRESGENVIDIEYDYEAIKTAVLKGLSEEFKSFCQTILNPYGNGTASEQIVELLTGLPKKKDLLLKQLNYDV